MKLGIMQPYFFPYIGYFQLIHDVNIFVVYDDVNYIKGGWVNRNYILLNGEKHLVTLRLRKASPNKRINEIEVDGNQKKIIKTIQQAYVRAPFYKDVYPLIEHVFKSGELNLAKFLLKSITKIVEYLEYDTHIILSSNIEKKNGLKGQDKVLHICELFRANQYINAIGGQDLYSPAEFAANNIDLRFLECKAEPYKQFSSEFVPNLSIIDVLMFNSIEQIRLMLKQFKLFANKKR